MITLARVYDLFINVDAPGGSPCLLNAAGSKRSDGDPVKWVMGDVFELRIHFRRLPTTLDGALSVVEQPSSWAIVVAGKTMGEAAGELVFSASEFQKVSTDDDAYYFARLSLNTDGLEAALADVEVGAYKLISVDVENQDATNQERLTYQFVAQIQQQVYAGEADPDPEEPQYPAPSAILTKIAGSQALVAEQDYVEVSGLGCTDVPQAIIVSVRKPAGGANIFATVDASSITVDGFRADLSGAAPDEGYALDFFVIQ